MMEDQEQEEQNPQRDASDSAVRFPAWIALAVLSIVTFFSAVGRRNSNTSAERWALAVTTLSWIFGIVGVLFYMYGRGIFMSQISEVILVGTTLLLHSLYLCTSLLGLMLILDSVYSLHSLLLYYDISLSSSLS